ncbi:VTT domain-containing protein [Phycicoccus sp. CSK15P-2]|uniref:DedA family protein n=1 Tax=Phycicoccus sp. CSK15P-2 TaxID=2807627 RepID=UPI001950C9D1|nr:VTT domain-containing protein [Phycicoccus sp. CSK15P-2]MBM6402968.1 VTT domain-containing protein [Phycicoccus sp. CSK15P-2]
MQAYLVIATLMLLEGPATTLAAGSMVGAGQLALLPVWLLAVGADVVADSVLFGVGRWGRHPRVRRILARLGLGAERLDRLQHGIGRHLPRVMIGAKLVDVSAVPAFLAAGLAGVPYRRFVVWTALTSAVRAAVLVALGVLAGHQLDALANSPATVASLSAALGGSLLLVSLTAKKLSSRRTGGEIL